MKVIIASIGSYGDLMPCLKMGLAFSSVGHTVHIWTSDSFKKIVLANGFIFHQIHETKVGGNLRSAHPNFGHPTKGLELVVDVFYDAIDPVLELVKEHYEPGNTLMLAPPRIFGARIAQELYGLPLISFHLAPGYMNTLDLYESEAVEIHLGPVLDDVRGKLGLPARTSSVMKWQVSPLAVLGLFPEWFFKGREDCPPDVHLLDFPFCFHRSPKLDDKIQTFLDRGTAPVFFTPGTYTPNTKGFFKSAIEIVNEMGLRAILAPIPPELCDTLPENILGLPWCSFHDVLPHVHTMVHAGGIGASSEAIRAGIPQIIIPAVFDQAGNGQHVESAGLGFCFPDGFHQGSIIDALKTIDAGSMRDRCQEVSEQYQELPFVDRLLAFVDELTSRDQILVGSIKTGK